MGRKIGGVTLVKDGKLKIGTLVAVLIGVPIYTFAREIAATIAFYGAGFSTAVGNASSWMERFVSVGLSSPEAGFRMARVSFAGAIQSYGILAFVVSIVIATVTTWILIEGVTRAR